MKYALKLLKKAADVLESGLETSTTGLVTIGQATTRFLAAVAHRSADQKIVDLGPVSLGTCDQVAAPAMSLRAFGATSFVTSPISTSVKQ